MVSHPEIVLLKTANNLLSAPLEFVTGFRGTLLFSLAIIGVLGAISRPDFDTDFLATIFICGAGFLCIHALTRFDSRYYLPVTVLGFIFAGQGIVKITRSLDAVKSKVPNCHAVTTLFLILLLVPNVAFVYSYHPEPALPQDQKQAVEIQELTEPGDIVVADSWMIVRWHSERTTIASPSDYNDLVESEIPNGDYLYLKDGPVNGNREGYPQKKLSRDYRVVREWENGAVLLKRVE